MKDIKFLLVAIIMFPAWFAQATIVLMWTRFELGWLPLVALSVTLLPLVPDLWSFYAHFVGTKKPVTTKALGIWVGIVVLYTFLVFTGGEHVANGPIWTKHLPEDLFWAIVLGTLFVRIVGGMTLGFFWGKAKSTL